MEKVKLSLLVLLFNIIGHAQNFDVVPLGIYGGEQEDNLSAYLLGAPEEKAFLCLDAGTVNAGIRKAIQLKSLDGSAESVLKDQIKGYFISHGHLDHLSGLIINSPADSKKNIFALPPVIQILQNHYFISDTWINFADQGQKPALGKYHYNELKEGTEISVPETPFFITGYELSHVNPYKSSAALVRRGDHYILYLGDTGADRIEKSDHLANLWSAIAPLIKKKQLSTVLIEVSFPNSQPEHLLFGHLTPKLLTEELTELKQKLGYASLEGLTIVVTHRKPTKDNPEIIRKELLENNILKVHYVFPEQGRKISLP
ncbi:MULTISPECIES: MBL fold metallo-hydrolase [Chryseobacterium]|uniref:cAMP phosphodiesterase n=1 Tax=Chryseobacterium camelliae TaxID=1265445 RepID=A0ABU0TJA6_9FLAO|nr:MULTISPECIES: 3',5'-cyclic-nucleotide phosphodiesterase [Chryseobacterium]MDT3409035.1 cAMP phosphodiesterase [Pseudacidovorax intermedius]MDQ1097107.1 cAMP phosphodiesterase [Chryseobacterium camelliae]MDQ1101044.1 cAMP phosphodiesterase [Chryseobacterium sp. SORGH_AS_1048]MDR6084487.1 cAMP phosphodiesterase [Chryseobacterium sp. SORGH_AS_0909]MDR6132757.1 cAMP phosphodiesterase [Chryseobacterium sp. SORGH_AS_1175]